MNRYNLEDQQVLPDKEILSGDLYCIAVNIKCKGSLKQIFEFFESLQNTDRMMRIESVKLTNDTKYSGKVDLETKAIVYYRSEQYDL
jgi:Tfp pilus assembly protein PilO